MYPQNATSNYENFNYIDNNEIKSFVPNSDLDFEIFKNAIRNEYSQIWINPNQAFIWKWQDDNGLWTPYEQDISVEIERCYRRNEIPELRILNNRGTIVLYRFNFFTMMQISVGTNFQRRIYKEYYQQNY